MNRNMNSDMTTGIMLLIGVLRLWFVISRRGRAVRINSGTSAGRRNLLCMWVKRSQ